MAVEDIKIELTRPPTTEPEKPGRDIDLSKTSLTPRTFSVTGMTCSSCVNTVEKSLNSISGVSASVNFATETVHILASAEIKSSEIIKKIKGAGYSATLIENGDGHALHSKKYGVALFFAILFAVPTIAMSMIHQWHAQLDIQILNTLSALNILPPLYSPTAWLAIALTTPLILLVALPIHRAALRNFFHPTMDSLISL